MQTLEIFLSVMLATSGFAIAVVFTPGPNNIMLAASGANFGYRKSLPHMLGIMLGVLLLMSLIALGLGELFKTSTTLQTLLKYLGSAYLLYLAYRIAISQAAKQDTETQAQPLTWWQAALFQAVNPKTWLCSISAFGAFAREGEFFLLSSAAVIATFMLVNFPAVSVWTLFGKAIGLWLHTDKQRYIFNGVMAGLTAGSVVFIFI